MAQNIKINLNINKIMDNKMQKTNVNTKTTARPSAGKTEVFSGKLEHVLVLCHGRAHRKI
jgi:hypothetical protein